LASGRTLRDFTSLYVTTNGGIRNTVYGVMGLSRIDLEHFLQITNQIQRTVKKERTGVVSLIFLSTYLCYAGPYSEELQSVT